MVLASESCGWLSVSWRLLAAGCDKRIIALPGEPMLIEEMGGDARAVYDGESALALLHEYQPEVVLLDIGMRGLDGYETCRRIRGVLGKQVLLVALTGFGQEQDKEDAIRAGFDAHLTKPADGAALARSLA